MDTPGFYCHIGCASTNDQLLDSHLIQDGCHKKGYNSVKFMGIKLKSDVGVIKTDPQLILQALTDRMRSVF